MRVFGEQTSTFSYHLYGDVAVNSRIDGVKTVGQHSDSVHAVVKCCLVGAYVDAVCESDYDKDIGTKPLEFADKMFAQFATIIAASPRAYDVDDSPAVEIGLPVVVEHQRSVFAEAQP